MQATEKIWMNGELVDWDDARIHVGAARAPLRHRRVRGHPLLRHAEGAGRLPADRPHAAPAQLGAADRHGAPVLGRRARATRRNDLLGANGLRECYIRPIAFYGFGQLGVSARDNPVETVIMSWPWGTYLGEEALAIGHPHEDLDAGSASRANVVPHASKATGVYLNSMLAVNEAQRAGYDEAILLTPEGNVADGPGETIFVVSEGKIYTPDLSTGILHGITRDSIIQIAADLGYEVRREER